MATTGRVSVKLSAFRENLLLLQKHASRCPAAVVKANAYGLGANALLPTLLEGGVRDFFVATAAEANQIAGDLASGCRVFVLEGVRTDTLSEIMAAGAIPVVNSATQLRVWSQQHPFAVHLDTGMHRLGVEMYDWQAFVGELTQPPAMVVSHFARSDEPHHPANLQQIESVRNLVSAIALKFGDQPQISMGNSPAVLGGLVPDWGTRAGIGLYGGNPFASLPNPLHPVVTFEGQIIGKRVLPAEVALGYGGTYTTTQTTTVATLGIGYADGVPRLLSNTGHVWATGHRLPVVGRVSMDMTQIDVTTADHLQEGDWVEVFGANLSVDAVAEQAHTISYEILTGLGNRPARLFH